MTTITLPWPPKELSPNSRTDRRATTAQRKAYRATAFWEVKRIKAQVAPNARLAITFCPPDARQRDLDNMLASIKSGLDGIAMACGVSDYGWSLSIERAEPVKDGAVLVRVCEPESWRSIGEIAASMIKGQIE